MILFAALAFAQLTSAAAPLTKEDIIKLAKDHAVSYCGRSTLGPLTKVGCEYSAVFDGKTWGVIVHSIYKDAQGTGVAVSGADRIYVFSPKGALLQEHYGQ
jgi:hypothetical protein